MSEGAQMTLEELEIRAARWGADIRLWPDGDRAAAERTLASSADAREALASLAALEADFALAAEAPVSADLTARILADAAAAAPGAAAQPQRAAPAANGGLSALLDRLLPAWRPVAACAASAMLGVWIGYLSPQNVAEAATQMAALDAPGGFAGIEPDDDAAMSFDLAYVAPEAFE